MVCTFLQTMLKYDIRLSQVKQLMFGAEPSSDFGMTIRLQSPIIFLLLHIFKGFTGKQFYLKSPSNFANITFYMLFLKSAMKATSHHFISDKECMWLLCKSF